MFYNYHLNSRQLNTLLASRRVADKEQLCWVRISSLQDLNSGLSLILFSLVLALDGSLSAEDRQPPEAEDGDRDEHEGDVDADEDEVDDAEHGGLTG